MGKVVYTQFPRPGPLKWTALTSVLYTHTGSGSSRILTTDGPSQLDLYDCNCGKLPGGFRAAVHAALDDFPSAWNLRVFTTKVLFWDTPVWQGCGSCTRQWVILHYLYTSWLPYFLPEGSPWAQTAAEDVTVGISERKMKLIFWHPGSAGFDWLNLKTADTFTMGVKPLKLWG